MFKLFQKKKRRRGGGQEQLPEDSRSPAAVETPRAAPRATVRLDDGAGALAAQPEAPPQAPAPHAAAAGLSRKTAEELCGIDASMDAAAIRARLANLFVRHNRAASSFDLELRAEAEIMLDAIVQMREKYVERL